jgi:hypothetical protein
VKVVAELTIGDGYMAVMRRPDGWLAWGDNLGRGGVLPKEQGWAAPLYLAALREMGLGPDPGAGLDRKIAFDNAVRMALGSKPAPKMTGPRWEEENDG